MRAFIGIISPDEAELRRAIKDKGNQQTVRALQALQWRALTACGGECGVNGQSGCSQSAHAAVAECQVDTALDGIGHTTALGILQSEHTAAAERLISHGASLHSAAAAAVTPAVPRSAVVPFLSPVCPRF